MKYLLLFLLLVGSLHSEHYMNRGLMGKWTSDKSNFIFIFNKDHTCEFYLGNKTIKGTWAIGDPINDVVVVDDQYVARSYKFLIFSDGGVKDGKMVKRLGMNFCRESWFNERGFDKCVDAVFRKTEREK